MASGIVRAHKGATRLVILDLSMPGMSADETLRQLRARNPDQNVIISSGYPESEALRIA